MEHIADYLSRIRGQEAEQACREHIVAALHSLCNAAIAARSAEYGSELRIEIERAINATTTVVGWLK